MSHIVNYPKNEDGAAAAEYALILAIICTGIAVALGTLGGDITTAINNAAADIAAA